jgi:hypothetical protein
MSGEVRVTLEGDQGDISADALHAALGSTVQLVKDASAAIGATAGRWNIEDLSVGSASFAIVNPAAPGVATLIAVGFESLMSSSSIPRHWTQRMVRKARDLGRLTGSGGVQGVLLSLPDTEPMRIDGTVTAHADAALETKEVSLGAVTGLVDVWRERHGRQIGLTLNTGETLTATYGPELAEHIRDHALGQQIEARGEIRRNASGQRVSLAIDSFDVLQPDVPMSIDELAGLYADLGKAGMTSREVLEHRE